MSFIKKSKEPPLLKEGDICEATIVDIQYPSQGKYKPQVQFTVDVQGYQARAWLAYYLTPHENSRLGIFCATLMKVDGREYATLDEVMAAAKQRKIYVKCTGYREYRGKRLPDFDIIVDHLPPTQAQLKTPDATCKQCGASVGNAKFCPDCGGKVSN